MANRKPVLKTWKPQQEAAHFHLLENHSCFFLGNWDQEMGGEVLDTETQKKLKGVRWMGLKKGWGWWLVEKARKFKNFEKPRNGEMMKLQRAGGRRRSNVGGNFQRKRVCIFSRTRVWAWAGLKEKNTAHLLTRRVMVKKKSKTIKKRKITSVPLAAARSQSPSSGRLCVSLSIICVSPAASSIPPLQIRQGPPRPPTSSHRRRLGLGNWKGGVDSEDIKSENWKGGGEEAVVFALVFKARDCIYSLLLGLLRIQMCCFFLFLWESGNMQCNK